MKKLALSSLLILLMVSCTINEDEPDTYWKVVNISVDEDDWIRRTENQGLNPYYTCEVEMPEITDFVFNSGLVQTYYLNGGPTGIQANLPFVRHRQDNINTDYLYTTTVDSEYSVGSISFFVTHSDFANVPPGDMSFRVVVMW